MSFLKSLAKFATGGWGTVAATALDAVLSRSARRHAESRADSSISRRVADARRAGINPLAALGANVDNGGFVDVGGSSFGDLATRLSQATQAREASSRADRLADAAISRDTAAAERDHATALLRASQLKRAETKANATQDVVKAPHSSRIVTPGGSWKTSRTTRQQEVEDEYGDIAGEGYGLWRLMNDGIDNISSWYHNSYVPAVKRWFGRKAPSRSSRVRTYPYRR